MAVFIFILYRVTAVAQEFSQEKIAQREQFALWQSLLSDHTFPPSALSAIMNTSVVSLQCNTVT